MDILFISGGAGHKSCNGGEILTAIYEVQGKDQDMVIFFSETLEGPYHPHHQNPVKQNGYGGRMAGRIQAYNGSLYRFGQDASLGYGTKVPICSD